MDKSLLFVVLLAIFFVGTVEKDIRFLGKGLRKLKLYKDGRGITFEEGTKIYRKAYHDWRDSINASKVMQRVGENLVILANRMKSNGGHKNIRKSDLA